MYVKIGKYATHHSLYNYLSKLEDKGYISEKTADRIDNFFYPVFWTWNNRPWNKRKIKVRIDNYDVWSLHETLSHVVHPMLVELKEQKNGSPFVDDQDVPENLRSTSVLKPEKEWDVDDNYHKRFEYILDEMIWAFEQDTIDWEDQFHKGDIDIFWEDVPGTDLTEMKSRNKDYSFDREGHDKHYDRMQNGFRLFGKYYQSLWD